MYLLFDIGGTNMRLAVSRTGRRIDRCVIISKPKNFKSGILAIKTTAKELSKGKKYKKVCGGVAGMLDARKTKLIYSPHLSGWINKPLKREFEKAFQAKVFLENDADLGGLGEAVYGAGKNRSIVAYIVIGTGIGGTRIVNKKIDANSIGFEPGHQIISAGQKAYLPPKYLGEWEGFVSGAAVEKHYGRKSTTIKDQKAWNYATKYLVYGLHNIVRLWSPEIIVLGGGLMQSRFISVVRIRAGLRQLLPNLPRFPIIRIGKLGQYAGLYGALALAKRVGN